jgi:hypothetical protein
MTIKGWGINADAAWLENSLDSLAKALGSFVEQGFMPFLKGCVRVGFAVY